MISANMTLFLIIDLKILSASKYEKHLGGIILKSYAIPLSYISINLKIEWIKAIRRSGKKNEVVEKADVQCQISE